MMRWILWTAAAVLLNLAPAPAADDEPKLNVGDKAPKFAVKEFVRGDPVKELAKGKTHVVEFWATWCGPCLETIPHLTELQKKHPDVNVIGVAVFERDFDKVKPFVKEQAEKMEYRVAIDAVPEGKEPEEGAMAKGWMDAAGQGGIPTAFIVNGDGVIAWIGHPKDMDKPLAEIVAGKWDVKAEAMRAKEERARERKFRAMVAKIRKAQDEGNPQSMLAAIDEAIKEDAKFEMMLGSLKFETLLALSDTDKTIAYGRRLIDDLYKDQAERLNEISWPIINPEREKKADPRLIKLALDAAKRSAELTKNKDPDVLDSLGCAYFADGNIAKAIETQELALKLRPDDEDLKAHLEKFKKALKDKDSKSP